MTEREYLFEQVAVEIKNLEDKQLATNFLKKPEELENMGVKELLPILRKCNAARNLGEFDQQFREWILETENKYHGKIADIYKVGNQKVQYTYFGILFTILKYKGCYLKGKNSSPIGITHKKYCSLLKLENRLKSKNVRKTIANDTYAHNYLLTIARRKKGEKVNDRLLAPHLKLLEPIVDEIADEVEKLFLVEP